MKIDPRDIAEKIDPRDIVKKHYRTLYDNRNGRPKAGDYALFLGAPAVVCSLPFWTGVAVGSTSGLLAASSVLGGLLFALLILVLEMAAGTAASAEQGGVTTRILRRVKVLSELSANVSYSVLISIVLTIILTAGEFMLPAGIAPIPGQPIIQPVQPASFTAIALFFLAHFVITLAMVLKRTFALTQRELELAAVPVERHN
ncbi:hypothetical protein ACFP63_08590 [Oerskovia jenensis]|uniref:Uncharacterized protein n=1 Tax=Oerskovia jenensis TaxID=162169 RepID=A0ABS2LJ20_9CELL|nr:hypothetical protein [Oerskovia jenensis]MBM7480108.1 hypothetical protein [Oerskovia jenensis]